MCLSACALATPGHSLRVSLVWRTHELCCPMAWGRLRVAPPADCGSLAVPTLCCVGITPAYGLCPAMVLSRSSTNATQSLSTMSVSMSVGSEDP